MATSTTPFYNFTIPPFEDIWSVQIPTKPVITLINPRLFESLKLVLVYAFQIPVLALGIGTNVIIIVTFLTSGIDDSMTLTFFALAVSDCGYVTTFFSLRLISMLQSVFKVKTYVRLSSLAYILSFVSLFFNDTSVLITMFAAFQKCCCVAIPHLFKNVFTRKRVLLAILCINVAMLLIYVPLLSGLRLHPSFSPILNRTELRVELGSVTIDVMEMWRVSNRIVLPMSAQGVVVVCLIIMVVCLQRSAQFRTTMTEEKGPPGKSSESSKLRDHERRALTAVAVVCAIFITATTPSIIFYYVLLIFPFLNNYEYGSLRYLIDNCENILIHINASVNLFVYLNYNSKFIETFKFLFKRKVVTK